ncbi:MAG: spore cortex biosynthesis protein YabQ [Clostridiales bacterium]|nr:spore cortex biosynthesis protein YabQ [Clostridiales bacterium]
MLGVIYDLFRIIRLTFFPNERFIFLQDIIYAVVCSFASFLFFLVINDGNVRVYEFAGEILGFSVYYFSLGTLVIRISSRIIKFLKQIIRLISAPFAAALRALSHLNNKIISKLQIFIKKIYKKSNYHLKLYNTMVYNIFHKGGFK